MHYSVHIYCMLPNKPTDPWILLQSFWITIDIRINGCRSFNGQIINKNICHLWNLIPENKDHTLLKFSWGVCVSHWHGREPKQTQWSGKSCKVTTVWMYPSGVKTPE